MQDPEKTPIGHPYPYPNPTGSAVVNEYPPTRIISGYWNNLLIHRYDILCGCIKLFILASVICGFILFFVAFIYSGVGYPNMPEFTVTSLSVSNFNFSSSSNRDSGTWNLEFLLRNPNKNASFSYDNVNCFVGYGDTHLTDTRLLPFKQENRDQRTIDLTLSESATNVDARVYDDIGRELAARGSVRFDVKFLSSVKFRYHGSFSDDVPLGVLCKDLTVEMSADSGSGKMNGPEKKCEVFNLNLKKSRMRFQYFSV